MIISRLAKNIIHMSYSAIWIFSSRIIINVKHYIIISRLTNNIIRHLSSGHTVQLGVTFALSLKFWKGYRPRIVEQCWFKLFCHRRRLKTSNKTTLVQCLAFAGNILVRCVYCRAVSAYYASKQILFFGFVERYARLEKN